MLELKGELVFKTVAYHRAADAIGRSPVDLVSAYRAGDPPRIPGVGKAISDKLAELATTGRLAFHERLQAEVPPRLVELLQIPGLGPKSVRQLHQELAIESLDDLRAAAEAGRLRTVRGMSARTEALVLEGLARLADRPPERMRLDRAEELVTAVIDGLARTPGVTSLEPAGSFRRRRESIGDLDLLAETTDPAGLMAAFTSLPMVDSVINKGTAKSAIRLIRGPQVDLMAMPPDAAGTYRIHFTGSKEHNVRLRAMARDRGWSLSEKGFLRIGEDGEPLTGDACRASDVRRPRRRPTRSSACPSSSRSCARTRARSRRRWPAELPRLVSLSRPARRPPQSLGLVGRPPADRGHHRRGPGARPRLPGPDRPFAVAGHRPRADPGSGRAAGAADRGAERSLRSRGGGRHGTGGHAAGRVPGPARLRAGDPRRRHARLRGRPAVALRPGRRLRPRRSPPVARRT